MKSRRPIPKKVAVFDIDGTIFRSSLLIELVETLITLNIISPDTRKEYVKEWNSWLNRDGSYDRYLDALVKAFHKRLRGLTEADMDKAIQHLLKKHQHHVYRYTRDLVRKLKKKNYFLLAISHSPRLVAERFADAMGFDKVYARLYEVNLSGRFTGRVLMGEWIDDKARILKRAVEKERLTLRGSVGVGDTGSDIRMLDLVDKPICFNPNESLFKEAHKKGWPVVVERKDVVYTFTP